MESVLWRRRLWNMIDRYERSLGWGRICMMYDGCIKDQRMYYALELRGR